MEGLVLLDPLVLKEVPVRWDYQDPKDSPATQGRLERWAHQAPQVKGEPMGRMESRGQLDPRAQQVWREREESWVH